MRGCSAGCQAALWHLEPGFVHAGRASLRLVWVWTSVLCHSEVSMSLGLLLCGVWLWWRCVARGLQDCWVDYKWSLESLSICLWLLGAFLFSWLLISPSLSVRFMTHTQHKIADLCICVFAVFSSSCFVFFVGFLYFISQSCTSWWPIVCFYSSSVLLISCFLLFLLFSSLSAFLYYTCAHILWILMEMNK